MCPCCTLWQATVASQRSSPKPALAEREPVLQLQTPCFSRRQCTARQAIMNFTPCPHFMQLGGPGRHFTVWCLHTYQALWTLPATPLVHQAAFGDRHLIVTSQDGEGCCSVSLLSLDNGSCQLVCPGIASSLINILGQATTTWGWAAC